MKDCRMHSNAYKVYRDQYIDLWNFASMISYAVPSLSKTIKGVELAVPNYSMVKSDLFKHDKTSLPRLKEVIKDYEKQLSSYLWIANFAFFEAYVKRLLDELVEFHGDINEYHIFIKKNINSYFKSNSEIMQTKDKLKRKLQKPFDGRKIQQYKKNINLLDGLGFHFPKDFYAAYGIKKIIEDIKEIRAKDIPDILCEAFLFDLSDDEIKKFISYKDKRNNIAHGENVNYSMYETIGMFKYFNEIAFKIDQHIFHNYFVREYIKET